MFFLIFLNLTQIFVGIFSIIHISVKIAFDVKEFKKNNIYKGKEIQVSFCNVIVSIWLICFIAISMIFTTGLLIFHIKIIKVNKTTREELKKLFENPFFNPFQRSVKQNLKNTLFPNISKKSLLDELRENKKDFYTYIKDVEEDISFIDNNKNINNDVTNIDKSIDKSNIMKDDKEEEDNNNIDNNNIDNIIENEMISDDRNRSNKNTINKIERYSEEEYLKKDINRNLIDNEKNNDNIKNIKENKLYEDIKNNIKKSKKNIFYEEKTNNNHFLDTMVNIEDKSSSNDAMNSLPINKGKNNNNDKNSFETNIKNKNYRIENVNILESTSYLPPPSSKINNLNGEEIKIKQRKKNIKRNNK